MSQSQQPPRLTLSTHLVAGLWTRSESIQNPVKNLQLIAPTVGNNSATATARTTAEDAIHFIVAELPLRLIF